MSEQEIEIILENVKEFIEKEIIPYENKLEKEGIDNEIILKLAEKGYLGIILPEEKGGTGLNEFQYSLILREFAKASPSVAVFLYLQNSVIIPLLLDSDTELANRKLEEILQGKIHGSLPLEDLTQYRRNYLEYHPEKRLLKGIKEFVLNSHANFLLALASNGDILVFVECDKLNKIENRRLGLRALHFSKFFIDTQLEEEQIIVRNSAKDKLATIYEESGLHIASVALGMSKETLFKAKEYSKKRKAFGKYLHEFQPIAFNISQIEIEIEAIESYLNQLIKTKNKTKALGAKLVSFELARKVSKLALQIHGGYGYFEDFKIEKFYRDSIALTVLFGNYLSDRTKISKYLIDQTSAEY